MIPTRARGLIVAAPSSGSGKTLVTLATLRYLSTNGCKVMSAKVGPDYIDPAFHACASGQSCANLDTWAMRRATLCDELERLCRDSDLVVIEGVMGLFDGAGCDDDLTDGSTASLARMTGWPVILVVDARAQAASAAAVVRGFVSHASDVNVAGVIFNQVGSDRHAGILRRACARHLPDMPVLGCLPRAPDLILPERHLGLVQAVEHSGLEAFLQSASSWIGQHVDMAALQNLARPSITFRSAHPSPAIPPLGQRTAVASDPAFAFQYAGVITGWRNAGVEVLPFSPLAGDGPPRQADSVYLPGGYPELHAGVLASNGFIGKLRAAAATGIPTFGECGGFMVLGNRLIDGDGNSHEMAGLLDVETSFADRKLHLGYRQMTSLAQSPLGPPGTRLRGHEFHYARISSNGSDRPLFDIRDASGTDLGSMGLVRASIAGSFCHVIDVRDDG